MDLADAVRKGGDDPALAARLDAKLSALLPSQAVSMHGNLDVIDKLKAQLQPLADRLEAFAARPAASITSAELATYAAEVKNASAAISRAFKEGFPAPGGGRFRPDRAPSWPASPKRSSRTSARPSARPGSATSRTASSASRRTSRSLIRKTSPTSASTLPTCASS